MMDANIVSILLDIKEQNGATGAQLHEASRSRERMEDRLKALGEKLDMVDHRTDTIEARQTAAADALVPIVKGIAAIELDLFENVKPDIGKLKMVAGKFTALWGAAFAILAWMLSYFSNEIRAFIVPPHHP